MEALGPACECLKCLWPPLARRLSYVKDLKKNFEKLKNEVKDLCNRKEDINREINGNTISKMPSTECKAWLTKLEYFVNQVTEIESKINANRRCFHVCCFPDIFSRKKLGKQVMNMLNNEVTKLKEASIHVGGTVLVDAPLQIVERVLVPNTEGQTSTDRLVQKILTWIRDDKIQKIGLWGMGGVGKTTIMKKLNNEPELHGAFDIVIWVTVSKDWSTMGVQNQIMQRLGMNRLDNEFDDSVARKLLRELDTRKYLLLLDDVWSEVNLDDIGIPMPNKRIGSKIVLTTRKYLVCKQMGTDEDIKIEVLLKEEAWRLFHKKVGDVIDSSNIEPIARQVVEECDGLPLAIIVVGGSMRKVKEVHAWESALEELRLSSFEIGDMEDRVFERLKFSYDRLKNDNVKNCFLYCALYPEDFQIPVEELVKHWREEGFISGVRSLDKAYKKGLTLLDGLIDDSLLERVDDDDNDYVKMHDVIRDLALRITSPNGKGPRFFVRAGVGIHECRNTGEWEAAERISLMGNYLSSLPASPTCNSLCTLLLQGNGSLKTIPELFFKHMHSLRVLNLSDTAISVLPPSVSSLVNLRALYILRAVLGLFIALPCEIGALKRLEVLHVKNIASLPLEVRELTNLRSLRVGCSGEKAMRRMCCDRVISSLCLLEDLRFYFVSNFYLEKWHEVVNIGVAEELCSLKHLICLKFEFSKTECLDHFVQKRCLMNCPELTQSCLSVRGAVGNPYLEREIMGKELIWSSGETVVSSGMKEVLSKALEFRLMGHKTVEKLSDFGIENLNTLQICQVRECLAIETIVSVEDGGANGSAKGNAAIVLPNLQELVLMDLPNLRSICDDLMPPPSFTTLRELWIRRCQKLRSVFTRGMIQHIPNLQVLDVSFCENMEEIVAESETKDQVADDDAVSFFPRLKKLKLKHMDKLVRIWKGVSQTWPSLEEVNVFGCPNLKTLNLKVTDNGTASSSSSSALRTIIGGRKWGEALEWKHNDDQLEHHLQPLFDSNEEEEHEDKEEEEELDMQDTRKF